MADGATSDPTGAASVETGSASMVIEPGGFPVGMLPVNHPQLAQLFRYWDKKRGDREMPSRADIRPEELGGILGNLFMVDVVPGVNGVRRFRYRLVGTALTAIMNQELTGRFIDEMPFLYRKFAMPAYHEILRARRPTYKETNAFEGWLVIRYKRLMLPLSSNGEDIDIVLGGIYTF